MGPEHMSNPIVKKFQGGYITNDWEKLLRRTAIYFKWVVIVAQKRVGEDCLSAHHMALLFWIRQAMPETRKAYREKEEQVDMKTITKEERQKAQQEVNKDICEEVSKSRVKGKSSRACLVSSMLKARHVFIELWEKTDMAEESQAGVNMVLGNREHEITRPVIGQADLENSPDVGNCGLCPNCCD